MSVVTVKTHGFLNQHLKENPIDRLCCRSYLPVLLHNLRGILFQISETFSLIFYESFCELFTYYKVIKK